MNVAYIDMMVDTIRGSVAMGGTTRIACEESRMLASVSSKTKLHLLACAGSEPGDYFDDVAFHVLKTKAKVLCERRELAARSKVMAAECVEYFKRARVDVMVSHSEPGLTTNIARQMPKLPIVFVHHLWPSTNKFFDLGRFRQLLEMDRLGVYVVFNSEPNRVRHMELAKKYGTSSTDAKEVDLCKRFFRWAKGRQDDVVSVLYAAPEVEFNADVAPWHVVASRCGSDKRIHAWASVDRSIRGLFTMWRESDYEVSTREALSKNANWKFKFGAPYTQVLSHLSRAASNLATGPTDSFGLTVFEAASMGTPSVLGRTGGYSAVDMLMQSHGVKLPVVDYSGGKFKQRAEAALDEAAAWSESRRRKLYDTFQTTFAKANVVKDRKRLINTAINLRS